MSPLAALFKDSKWLVKLTYPVDIFTKFNDLNVSLEDRDSSILKLYD